MKTSHLTFGQLLSLYHPKTIQRLTAAYHSALRRRTAAVYGANEVSIASMVALFPQVAHAYEPLLLFLCGDQLRRAVRKAADNAYVPFIPGGRRKIADFPVGSIPASRWESVVRATSIVALCLSAKVPAFIAVEKSCGSLRMRVYAETNEYGDMVLTHRSGLPWNVLQLLCQHTDTSAESVFRWVPVEHRRANGCVNPIVFPMDTPNCTQIAEELVS